MPDGWDAAAGGFAMMMGNALVVDVDRSADLRFVFEAEAAAMACRGLDDADGVNVSVCPFCVNAGVVRKMRITANSRCRAASRSF
jgi:hypothetical protein